MKLATVIILLMAMINLVPPMFAGGVYFDNVYYTILYMLLAFIGIALPFIVKLPGYLTAISHVLGGWFVAGLYFEVVNFKAPEVVINNDSSPELFIKAVVCFTVAITFIMINYTWKRNT